MAVEPVIRDLRTTWWGFDTKERVLFPGDGFAYSHYHEDGHCGLIAEEAVSLDLPDVSSTFADLALFWTKFADMNVYCDRLDHLIARLDVKIIGPTHGLPITDVKTTVPKVQAGLKAAALMPESGTNEKVAVALIDPPPFTGEAASEAMPEGVSARLRKRHGRRPPPYPPPQAGEGRGRFAALQLGLLSRALLLPLDRPAIMRKRQPEIFAQRLAFVFATEQAAALQFGNEQIDDVFEPARKGQRQNVETVGRAAAEPLFERVGDFGRRCR